MSPPATPGVLLSHADLEAFAPMTRVILAKLGYQVLRPEELASIEGHEAVRPIVCVFDEGQLGEIPDDGPPVLLITPHRDAAAGHPRIAGSVTRPAGMRELYCLIQQLTETTPRGSPRVGVAIRARCCAGGREWEATIVSLSENGCLVHGGPVPERGSRLQLRFELPQGERFDLESEVAYPLAGGAGVIFQSVPDHGRRAIARFIEQVLLG